MKAVFLSDAHITGHADPNLPPLLAFLETLRGRLDRLYLVGDLFDTWFAFPRAVFDTYIPLLGALDAVHRAGTKLVYVTGNHDFEMGDCFRKILDADVHDTDVEVNEDGRRAYVAHGDLANPKDKGYRRLRAILRSGLVRWLGRRLPPSWVWHAAHGLRRTCGRERWADGNGLGEVFSAHAAEKHKEGFDTVILGHSHEPVFEEAEGRAYVNLGDWISARTWLEWTDGALRLKQWVWPEAESRDFEPSASPSANYSSMRK